MWKNGTGDEAPKASRGWGYGEGVSPFPSDYGVWGERRKLPSGVRGEAPENFDF